MSRHRPWKKKTSQKSQDKKVTPAPLVTQPAAPYQPPDPKAKSPLKDLVRRIQITAGHAIVLQSRRGDRAFVIRQIEYNLDRLPREIADQYGKELDEITKKK